MRFHYSKFWKYRTRFLITQEDFRNRRARGVCQESDTIVIVGSWKLYLSFVANFVASFVEPDKVLIVIVILIVIDTKGAQALRVAGQPVVAGLVLRCGAP